MASEGQIYRDRPKKKKKMLGKEVSESGGVSKKILKKEVLFQ